MPGIADHPYLRAEAEIAAGPDVFFVEFEHQSGSSSKDPLYAVQLPQDIDLFRLWDDENGLDMMFFYGRRWRRLTGRIWKQRKGLELDAAMNDRVPITSFCRKLRKMGVKPWKRR